MLTTYLGEISAIGTAIAFAFGSTLFTLSGRLVGSPLVNRTRLLIALLLVIMLHWIRLGDPLPLDAGGDPWFWLGLSGFVGLALGDASLFQAFVLIGPRISMLIMALAPVLAAVIAWLFLGEQLILQEILGIIVTIAGIAMVVTERQARKANAPIEENSTRTYLLGLLFAFGGAMGQAGGQVLAKVGLADGFPALSGLVIRIIVASLVMWSLSAMQGQVMNSYHRLKANPRAFWMVLGAAVIGPVVGVWLSLIAVQNAPVGVATALSSLTPVFLIPIAYVVFKEQITWQATVGTLIAFVGTALLFL